MARCSLWVIPKPRNALSKLEARSNPLCEEAEPRFKTRLELQQEFGVLGSDGGLSMSRAMDIEMIMDHFLDGDSR